jgi:Arc/MetJ-type ribon-helix-helix transcriptional regulator
LTPGTPDFDDAAMSLPRIKLTLPPNLREYVARRMALGGYVNAGEYMRQLIRSDATEQQDRRLGDSLAADETRRGGTPAGDSR